MPKANQKILSHRMAGEIKMKCSIRLDRLFETDEERRRFEEKWSDFSKADYNSELYRKKGNILHYDSEQLVPSKRNRRTPLLLVLGNPAGQSVLNGMFFSFEGKKKVHRMWRSILDGTVLSGLTRQGGASLKKMNDDRRKQILSLGYESKFCLGMCVFITMPSPAGGKWGGVAGIQKLFGASAFRRLEVEETDRVIEIAKGFVKKKGAVVAFQKNAWNALRNDSDPAFTIQDAKSSKLKGSLKGAKILLLGVPPTRLTGPCRDVLSAHLRKTFR